MEIDALFGTSKNYLHLRVGVGIILLGVWIFLFGMGISIPSIDLKGAMIKDTKSMDWELFVLYGLTYTPISAAILAAISGTLGGIASNLAAYNQKDHVNISKLDPKSFEYKSLIYMTEHPLVAALRGFLAFLILVAGSYIASFSALEDTTATAAKVINTTAGSYFKFAVTVSLLSYLVGYDPTHLQRLIGSLTTIGGKSVTDISGEVSFNDGKHKGKAHIDATATTTPQTDSKATESKPVNTTESVNSAKSIALN